MFGTFDPGLLVEATSLSGLAVLFACVFLDQAGIPVPAYPPLMAASAIASVHHRAVWPILAVAAVATLVADYAWYAGGRRFGARMMRLICRVSISPDACVSSTRDTYARWGPVSLVVAKFVPGFAAFATTLAGDTRLPARTFLVFDGLGAVLWVAVPVVLGVLFDDAIRDLLRVAGAAGHYAVLVLAGALAALLAWKAVRKKRRASVPTMQATQLRKRLARGPAPVIVDARSFHSRAQGDGIPTALAREHVPDSARDAEIVVYCDCPQDAAARTVAREMHARGFGHVRVLSGGLQAWQASAASAFDVPVTVS